MTRPFSIPQLRAEFDRRVIAPVPDGRDRIDRTVADIAAEVDQLRAAGLRVRNDIITGPGDSQILLGDPAGNAVELLQPAS